MNIQKQSPFGFITVFLTGIGQIMLQNNPWTVLLFLVGICFGSLTMGLAAGISVITGTITAVLLRYPKDEIDSGLYGFSAALVGVALICFFQPAAVIWLAILVGSAMAAVIQRFSIVKKIPAFTSVYSGHLVVFSDCPLLPGVSSVTACSCRRLCE